MKMMHGPPLTGYRLTPALTVLSYGTELFTAHIYKWAVSGLPKSSPTLLPSAVLLAETLPFIFDFVVFALTPVSAPVSMPEG